MKKTDYPQLSELSGELRQLQSEFRLLQQEWVESHRKLLNTLRSINRGGGKKALEASDANSAAPAAGPPSMDKVTQAILARRGIKWDTHGATNQSE